MSVPTWHVLRPQPGLALDVGNQLPKHKIAEGLEISQVIKGCWQLSGGHSGDRNTDRTRGAEAVQDIGTFVRNGITTLDTADIYGPSEEIIGRFFEQNIDARDRCQVLTKFCCFGDSMRQASSLDFVKRSIDRSRLRLQAKTLDCVQFYWHDYGNKLYTDAALNLAELKSQGLLKTIGVTNFDVAKIDEMVTAGVPIVCNQIQYSMLDTRPENGMTDYCLAKNISILPFGTVAGGFLTNKYLGKSPREVTLNTYSLQKYASIIAQRGGWDWYQDLLMVLDSIAKQYDVGIAEVASKFILQKPAVGAVILGARNANHVADHLKMFSFTLSTRDIEAIEGVLATGNRPTSDVYTFERGGEW